MIFRRWSKVAILALTVLLVSGPPAWAINGRHTFRVVLVPERNIFEQQRKYNTLADYASSMLPMDFSFEVLKGYREVLEAMKEGKADGAFMGSFVAAYGIDNLGFIPIVRPVWSNGDSHYSSIVFKRSDLPVTRDISTWKGMSFVFVSPDTSAGYFFPLSLLRSNGVKEPGVFFSSIQFAGSHDAAVWMVANEMGDIGAAKNTVFEEYLKRNPELEKKIEILYTGGRYPDSALVVRSEVPQEVRESLRTLFLRMSSHQGGQEVLKMFGARKFINTTPEEYGDVRQVVRGSGYEMKNIGLLD